MAKKHREQSVLNRQAEINSDFTKVNPQRTEAPACLKAGMIYAGHPVSFVCFLDILANCVQNRPACYLYRTYKRQVGIGALGRTLTSAPALTTTKRCKNGGLAMAKDKGKSPSKSGQPKIDKEFKERITSRSVRIEEGILNGEGLGVSSAKDLGDTIASSISYLCMCLSLALYCIVEKLDDAFYTKAKKAVISDDPAMEKETKEKEDKKS